MKTLLPFVLALIIFVLLNSQTYCQVSVLDTGITRFTRFAGEWKLKDNIWKSKFGGDYQESIDTTRSFVIKVASPANTLLWNGDFGGGSWAVLF